VANRVTFLVDGFNLHYSLLEAKSLLGIARLRWLNVDALLRSYLSVFGPEAVLEEIHFFSAIPSFRQQRDSRGVHAHETHLEALRGAGIHLHIATFKRKDLTCPYCGKTIQRHEEKESDVALGVKAVELLHLRACDTLVIVSGDTDFAPALRTAKRLFPKVEVCVAFPHARFNAELQQIADFSFRIRAARYADHQFPDPVWLPDGRVLTRPPGW